MEDQYQKDKVFVQCAMVISSMGMTDIAVEKWRMNLKDRWKRNAKKPKIGAKIEYMVDIKDIHVAVWLGDRLTDDTPWHKISIWRYLDKDYLERISDEDKCYMDNL